MGTIRFVNFNKIEGRTCSDFKLIRETGESVLIFRFLIEWKRFKL